MFRLQLPDLSCQGIHLTRETLMSLVLVVYRILRSHMAVSENEGRSPEITSLWWTNVQKLPVYDEQTFFLVLNKQTMCCKWATMWGLQLAKPRGYDSLVQRQSAVQGIIISVATIFFGWVDSTPQSLVLKNLDRLLVLLNYEDDWYWLIHVHLLW